LETDLSLEDFYFRHETVNISNLFNNLSNLYRTITRGKRKKPKGKPIDIQMQISTKGTNNRIETDFIKMIFEGDVEIGGTYPYLLATGEVNSLAGEFGVTSNAYDLKDFELRWNGQPLEDGKIVLQAENHLATDCTPNNPDSCTLGLMLSGTINNMNFSYEGSCGGELGETVEPIAMLTTIGKGCYDEGQTGRDVAIRWAEGKFSDYSSKQIRKWSYGWLQRSSISGVEHLFQEDEEEDLKTEGNREALTLEVETKEWQRLQLRAKAGYVPGAAEGTQYESEAGITWRPPLEHLSKNSTWKHRVKKRVNVESLVKTGSSQETLTSEEDQQRETRYQLGINYNYEFWEIW
jgi:hypothetical protein